MTTDTIVAVAVVFSLLGLIIIVYILVNSICLWQAKLMQTSTGDAISDSDASSIKTNCLKSQKYQVRSYMGCLPRLKGPRRSLTKKYEYPIRQCWFRMCCLCCQELDENKPFLDEVCIAPGVIIPSLSKPDKRPHGLPAVSTHVNIVSFDTGGPDVHDSKSWRDTNMPKISILAPDPIMVSMDGYSPVQSNPIAEDTEPMDFYAYQLEGKAGERMLY